MLITFPKRALSVLGCLFLVYISWGSSFIGIKFALESFPPFILIGVRMCTAGAFLYLYTLLKGERTPLRRYEWKQDLILAFLMVVMGSGFLSLGQTTTSTGTAALICGSVPILMVLGGWLFCGENRPTGKQFFGLFMGFVGLTWLTIHQGSTGQDSLWGLLLVFLAACGWVAGSFYSKKHRSENRHSLFRTNGIIMFLGGALCFLLGLFFGEFSEFSPTAITTRSLLAMGYLVIMGAVVAYTAYFWLLLNTRTAVAISYEYVNPVIAVFLGWWLLDERVDTVVILTCILTVGAVFFIIGREKE